MSGIRIAGCIVMVAAVVGTARTEAGDLHFPALVVPAGYPRLMVAADIAPVPSDAPQVLAPDLPAASVVGSTAAFAAEPEHSRFVEPGGLVLLGPIHRVATARPPLGDLHRVADAGSRR